MPRLNTEAESVGTLLSTNLPARSDGHLESPQILDCSFRDGGYLNNWDFPLSRVRNHLERLSEAGVGFCEVGFRMPTPLNTSFLGALGNVTPDLIGELSRDFPAMKLGVMVNSADYSDSTSLVESLKPASNLGFVRIATRMSDFSRSVELASALREMGYLVFLNLMQASELHLDNLKEVVASLELDHLSGLYFADSTGAMRPTEVGNLIGWASTCIPVPIGVHFHDNSSLAFANSLEAVEAGATYVDGTILGIGRGAGNTRLELLALEYLSREGFGKVALLAEDWAVWLRGRGNFTRWGPSWEYALAAHRKVHPTYVQSISEEETYSGAEKLTVIEMLGQKSSIRYQESELRVGVEWFERAGRTSDAVRDLFAEQDVLLVGPGESGSDYEEELNRTADLLGLVTCIVGGHEARIQSKYRFLSHPLTVMSQPEVLDCRETLIGPLTQFELESPGVARGISVDMRVISDGFGFDGETVCTPSTRSAIFALSLLSGLKCRTIYLAGFDGFSSGDPRNRDFEHALRKLKDFGKPVISLTPTRHDVLFRTFE